jgi:hypothetical protein
VSQHTAGRLQITELGGIFKLCEFLRKPLAHGWLFRMGFIGELLSVVFFLLAAWAL